MANIALLLYVLRLMEVLELLERALSTLCRLDSLAKVVASE